MRGDATRCVRAFEAGVFGVDDPSSMTTHEMQAPDTELSDHLGYDKGAAEEALFTNSRNGAGSKNVGLAGR